MPAPVRWSILPTAILSAVTLLLLTGCAAGPDTLKPGVARLQQFNYQNSPSPVRLDASATVEAAITFAPEIRAVWHGWGSNDQTLDAYLRTVAEALKSDIASSGPFARVLAPGLGQPDYLIKIQAEEYNPADLRLRMTIRLIDPATGNELFARNAEVPLGLNCGGPRQRNAIMPLRPPNFPPDAGSGWSGMNLLTGSLQSGAQQLMPVMKSGVGQFLLAGLEKSAERRLDSASLAELLVATDASATLARARNRALIAAKNQQLPALLREKKTDELAAFVIKIEQTILDLNHEGELAKDRAQQVTAAGGDPARIDEIRGLSLSYRERIELLKPILAALKDEIANRNR
jgi:hypothetical protein